MKIISLKSNLIGLFILTVSLSACFRDKIEPIPKITINNIAGTYKTTGMAYQGNDGSNEDEYPLLNECQRNSLQTLREDMTYEEVDTCSPPTSHNSTWSLPSTSTIIIDRINYGLISFDGHTLILSMSLSGRDGKIIKRMAKQ